MSNQNMLEVGFYNFEQEVVNSPIPVVVVVHKDGPVCKQYLSVINDATLTHSKHFKFCKLDARKSQSLAQELTDSAFPAIALYCDGRLFTTLTSVPTVDYLREYLNRQTVAINRKRYRTQQSISTK